MRTNAWPGEYCQPYQPSMKYASLSRSAASVIFCVSSMITPKGCGRLSTKATRFSMVAAALSLNVALVLSSGWRISSMWRISGSNTRIRSASPRTRSAG